MVHFEIQMTLPKGALPYLHPKELLGTVEEVNENLPFANDTYVWTAPQTRH